MTPALILFYVVAALWLGGGTLWLLSHRRYRITQAPQFAMDLLGFPVEIAQAVFGRGVVPYAFLLPNMLIFGLFTFVPVILNFYVSMTGGPALNVTQRPFVGFENYRVLFDCASILQPQTCSNAGFTFWTSMFNTLWFVLFQVPVLVAVAMVTALVLNRAIAGRGFWRAMFFYPVMLSPVVIANIWKWILHRKGVLSASLEDGAASVATFAGVTGFSIMACVVLAILLLIAAERTLRAGAAPSVVWAALFGAPFVAVIAWADPVGLAQGMASGTGLWLGLALALGLLGLVIRDHRLVRPVLVALCLLAVGLLLTIQFDAVFDFSGFRAVNWLVTPATGWPFFWIVFVFCWSHMGFYMLILLAGLQAIPRDIYEAAEMDGTRPVRVFFRITLPLVMPTLTVVIVLAMIRSFQVFDEVYLLTGGGPGRETFMIVQNIFEEAFSGTNPRYGIAAAGSVLMAIVIAAFTAVQLFATRRRSGI